MDNNDDVNKRTVGGFVFLTSEDAKMAESEQQKIQYIESHTHKAGKDSCLAVYEKALENKLFVTPVGWSYLQLLRRRLKKLGVDENSLTSISVNSVFTVSNSPDDYVPKPRIRQVPDKEKKRNMLTISIAVNVILALMVLMMFFIANNSKADNIINYKKNITNRYSSWEQELSERETAVKQKEKELGIVYTEGKADNG